MILLRGESFTEEKMIAAHFRSRVVGVLFLGVPSSNKSRPDDLLYLMPAFIIWTMLLLTLSLGMTITDVASS